MESVNIVENRRFFDRTLKKEIPPNRNGDSEGELVAKLGAYRELKGWRGS